MDAVPQLSPASAPRVRGVLLGPEVRADGGAAIWTRALVRQFRHKTAVDHLDLHVPHGSICGFVGPNGAGKTTTIRMLMGLLPPSGGQVRVLGLDPRRQSLDLRRRVGYVPDLHHIYPWMDIRQVLRFAAGVFGRRWDVRESNRMIDLLKLPLDRKVKQLSRGEMAKLALVVALGHDPQLLVLDEPTTGLDPLIRDEFLSAILELAAGRQRTVFFSSHILSDVERVADRLIVLDRGRVLAQGTLEELRSRYTKASFVFRAPPPRELIIPGAVRIQKGVREWVAIFPAAAGATLAQVARTIGAQDLMPHHMTVEDVFLELFNQQANGRTHDPAAGPTNGTGDSAPGKGASEAAEHAPAGPPHAPAAPPPTHQER